MVTQKFLHHLRSLKVRHSKSKFLSCENLKSADYIQSPLFSTKEKELLFKLRSKTLEVKQNFPGQYGSPWCLSCGLFQETQSHLLQCPEIVLNPQPAGGGPIGPPRIEKIISPEPNVRLTSNQDVNSSLYVV